MEVGENIGVLRCPRAGDVLNVSAQTSSHICGRCDVGTLDAPSAFVIPSPVDLATACVRHDRARLCIHAPDDVERALAISRNAERITHRSGSDDADSKPGERAGSQSDAKCRQIRRSGTDFAKDCIDEQGEDFAMRVISKVIPAGNYLVTVDKRDGDRRR